MDSVEIELEIDPLVAGTPGRSLVDVDDPSFTDNGIAVKVIAAEEGHGFGVSEIVTIALAIAGSAASDLVASAIKEGTKGVIRRARARTSRSDGSVEGLAELIDSERRPDDTDPSDSTEQEL
ncbi:hypothetical protein [Streptomyces griseorubiginosus]|uniref:hypothetical protein n=1 Tax=Streptomyces griseorubiginosus TaxID=67304 RepID=UPI0036EB2D36